MLECDEPIEDGQETLELEVYDTPWQEEPVTVVLHYDLGVEWGEDCASRLSDTAWGDFRYLECDDCMRLVCQQNPANGWHVQFRQTDYGYVCLQCYQAAILENGISREEVEAGRLPGMFFDRGNPELVDWSNHGEYFVNGDYSATPIRKMILGLMDDGRKVIIAYESMGIGGGEGYISVYSKGVTE